MQNRLQTPELLKGIAVVFMIQVHLMELFARQEIYDGTLGKISLFLGGVPAAPVFMVVMGYFLAYGKKQPMKMMLRGIKLFIAGIVLNIGLNAHLIYRVYHDGWQVNIWHYIFGVDILHLAGLSLIILAALSYIYQRSFIPYIITALVVVLISSFIPVYSNESNLGTYLMAYIHSNAEWSYFPLIPWLAYPLTGFAFQLFEEKVLTIKISTSLKVGSLLVFTTLLFLTFQYASEITHNLKAYYHHGLNFYLWSITFIIFWSLSVSLAEEFAGKTKVLKFIKWLGKNVTTVYIIQWLIIGNIATAIFKTQSLTETLLWFGGIVILTSLLTLLWNKTISTYNLKFIKL